MTEEKPPVVALLEADKGWQIAVKLALDANLRVVVQVCNDISRALRLKPEAIDLAILGDLRPEQMRRALDWAEERHKSGLSTMLLSDVGRVHGLPFFQKAKFGDATRFLKEVELRLAR